MAGMQDEFARRWNRKPPHEWHADWRREGAEVPEVPRCKACGVDVPNRRLTRNGHPLCGDCFADKSAAELDALGVVWADA